MWFTTIKIAATVSLLIATGAGAHAYQDAKQAPPSPSEAERAAKVKAIEAEVDRKLALPTPKPAIEEPDQDSKPAPARLSKAERAAKTKAIHDSLDREVVLKILNRTTFEEALKIVKEASKTPGIPDGIPIYVDPIGLQELKVSMDSPLEGIIPADEIPLSQYLDMVLEPLGLGYAVKDGILTVITKDGVIGETFAELREMIETLTKRVEALESNAVLKPGAADLPGKPLVLFDGKTLDGWKKTDFFQAGEVKVEDGSIILTHGPKMSGITSTRKDLPKIDYELTYEAMRTAGTDFFAAATFPVGESFLTFVNGGWGGNVTGLSSLNGSDASENPTNHFFKYKDKTWYKFRVRVTDAVIRCWIDDAPIVAVNYKGQTVGTRLETRPSQPLGFATWESGGAVRKVEVRRLTPDEVAANNRLDEE